MIDRLICRKETKPKKKKETPFSTFSAVTNFDATSWHQPKGKKTGNRFSTYHIDE
jgi:hypothetical protein